ncbi:ABC transporter ATP-binding protein [Micromonosporaceae bacterium Da 78-11]
MSVLIAHGAGVRHGRRWLFRDLDVSVEPGELVAVVGPPGSGRTTLLLALARRFRLSAGQVTITGTASLGYVPDVESPEPVFTVAEHVRERLALLGRSRGAAADVPLHGLDPAAQGRDLTPYQKQVLGLILAGLDRPDVLALDGFDYGLDVAEQAELWRLLGEITATGTAVLLTAREVDPARVSTTIRLGPPQQPTADVMPPQATDEGDAADQEETVEPPAEDGKDADEDDVAGAKS